ncbi:hypothetical protein COU76_00785 [Candidatus Peregrinibacteria bacterium CG10_big_fil_rev_8_21_14_0_10_49_10]|nr:MAG: hypothetical protein COU76_00785 [Candidatus Peregrinibacteria bacterium CG10_big_fil_rev_8_21_14_0_10_49_10]
MNKELTEAVAKTKLASLLVIFMFFTASLWLIKGESSFLSPSAIAGFIFLVIGILMAVLCLFVYLLKEHSADIASRYEAIIKVQQGALEAKGRPYEQLDSATRTATNLQSPSETSITIPEADSTPTS